MSIEIPRRHKDEEDASVDQKEKLVNIGICDTKVLSQLGVHQANNIISFVEGTKYVISHFSSPFDDKFSAMEHNLQINDAIVQANLSVLTDAPAMAMGSLYQTISNSVAMAAANAVYAQQQANVAYQAATGTAISRLTNKSTS